MKRTAGGGHAAKHTRSAHGKTGKHNPRGTRRAGGAQGRGTAHTVARHPAHTKARGMALTLDAVACCAAEALGASLRLARWPVGDGDVLALHEAAGGSQDRGVPLLAVILAARRHGLAGVRPLGWKAADLGQVACAGLAIPDRHLILGLDFAEGPHYVTVAGDGCWISWGKHHDPAEWPGAVVEEAWAVTWP